MGAASFAQTSFLGGEWSPQFQGRTDHPRYKTALNTTLNVIPIEEGCAIRRPGIEFSSPTYFGRIASLLAYKATQDKPYNIELTQETLRLFQGYYNILNDDLVEITAISGATPAVMSIAIDQGWPSNTQIRINYDDYTAAMQYPDTGQYVQRRTFNLTRLTGTTYALLDGVTNANVDGSKINYDHTHAPMSAQSILQITTPYLAADLSTIRIVQDQERAVLLHNSYQPQQLTVTPDDTTIWIAEADLNPISFVDGPYNDPLFNVNLVTDISADPSVVTLTLSYNSYSVSITYGIGDHVITSGLTPHVYVSLVDDNKNNAPATNPLKWKQVDAGDVVGNGGFQTSDIGRHMRLYCEPFDWDVSATYNKGDPVKYQGGYYTQIATAPQAGALPDTDTTTWLPTTSTAVVAWTWGKIITINSTSSVDIQVRGGPVLYNDAFIRTWRLGTFSDTTGWPACGVFHQGRMWLGGCIENRFDASTSNDIYNFAPTSIDGTVADNNSISGTFNATDLNQISWMEATGQGIIAGTAGGEWLIQASALNDPITPTNVQAHRVTKYRCSNVAPVNAGLALVFVQQYGRSLLEFLADVFSGKFSAPSVNLHAKHLSRSGIKQLAFQQGITPIVWALKNDGSLAGMTYKRLSSFVTEEPSYSAWFRVALGDTNQDIVSIITNTREDGELDTLYAVVRNIQQNIHYVCSLSPIPEDDLTLPNSWYFDDATWASGGLITTENSKQGIRLYGLWHLEGQTVNVFMGGVNFKTYTVADGSCFVPAADGGGLFVIGAPMDPTYASTVSTLPNTLVSQGSGTTTYPVACLVGIAYNSDGQLLRPGTAPEAGSQNGPPFLKIRRGHKYGTLLLNCVRGGIDFGTKFSKLRPALFRTEGGTDYKANQLFSGTYWNTLEDDYGYDTMLCWRATGPWPATILSLGGFLHTQDS